jgi:hypothetical protein
METYSASLTGMVGSAQRGEQAARELAQSVQLLGSTVSSAFPAGDPLVQSVTDAVAGVYGLIVTQMAVRELDKAMLAADPAIQKVAQLVQRDLLDLATILDQNRRQALSALAFETEDLPRLNLLLQVRKDAADVEPIDFEELRRVGEAILLETQSPWYLEYQERRAGILANHDSQRAVLEQAALTVSIWASSHREMATALEQRRLPSLAELQSVTADLREIYKQTRLRRQP